MRQRRNCYADLIADYSALDPVPADLAGQLLDDSARYIAMKEPALPPIGPDYTLAEIEAENRAWWPTHCEALRQGRGDLLTGEYREDLVYHCQDGPYRGIDEQKSRELHWWALIAQPGARMTWPVVMFSGEFVWFEWACIDLETHETIAKGSVSWVRRGHRGGCYYKGEQLTFYRDVYAPQALVDRITAADAGQPRSNATEPIARTGAANPHRADAMEPGLPRDAATARAPKTPRPALANATDDPPLQEALRTLNPGWGDFCIRVAGEAWGLPLIDQRTKALITIAVDVVNGNANGPGSPFEAHVDMALKQGVTRAELEELMLFMSVYAGFNKAASGVGKLQEITAKGKTFLGARIQP